MTTVRHSGHESFKDLDIRIGAGDQWGPHAWFEFSVPRHYDVTNSQPAGAEQVSEAVENIWEATSEVVDWCGTPADMTVTRLDYVTDFYQIPDIDLVLDRLHAVLARGGKVKTNYAHPRTGRSQSETVATPKRWKLTVYNKYQEMVLASRRIRDPRRRSQHLAEAHRVRARGQLRAEVSLRSPVLGERAGGRRLADLLRDDHVPALAQHYWHTSGFGTAVHGPAHLRQVITDLQKDGDSRWKYARDLVGSLWLDAEGIGQPGAEATVSKYRHMAADLGLTPADLAAIQGPPTRLDWDSASLVQVAA